SPVGGGWRLVLEAAAGKIIGSTGLAAARPPPRDSGTPAGRGRPVGGDAGRAVRPAGRARRPGS
ncbi:hypothetical protein, partial [Streptomyces glaucescens]|uniref:hypothetical protein n=1 Tax=Streptomyces glaucescens TaxID=1907 RepID=UPI003BB7F9B0